MFTRSRDSVLESYLNCAFMTFRRQALNYSVVMKQKSSKKAKLSIFKRVFVPILNYGHKSWVMFDEQKSAITSASIRNEFFTKNRRSYNI